GFAEWNGRFRDDVRRFWKGDADMRGAIAARLLGSADMFGHHRRRPWASINFITAHDGFTLNDLVSYNDKHNEANGEDNRDGANVNESCNWGAEGETDDQDVMDMRERVRRAMLMTLFFSNGTPMLLGGDEFGRTQNGNNNAYCQDNELSWISWDLAETDTGKSLFEFVQRCIAARRARPTLHSPRFYTGDVEILLGLYDTSWFDEYGQPMTEESWHYSEGRLLMLRRVARIEGHRNAEPEITASLLLLNAHWEDREFILPEPALDWQVLIDAAQKNDAPPAHVPGQNRLVVGARSSVLLVADHVV